MQIVLGITIKDAAIGWDDFTQQVAIMVKVKELPKVLRENIIKLHSRRKNYRAATNTLNNPVSTCKISLRLMIRKVREKPAATRKEDDLSSR